MKNAYPYPSYGERFGAGLAAHGYEDVADFRATGGINPSLLAAVVRSKGGNPPQILRLLKAAEASNFLSSGEREAWLEDIEPGYAHRFATAFADAGYESIADREFHSFSLYLLSSSSRCLLERPLAVSSSSICLPPIGLHSPTPRPARPPSAHAAFKSGYAQ